MFSAAEEREGKGEGGIQLRGAVIT